RQRAHQEVAEGRTRVRTAAFPLADDIVAFRDQIRRAPEIEIRECSAEIGHECLDVVTAAARLVQGILLEHVGRGELIDDAEIASLAPKLGEPPADNGLVVLCFAHLDTLPCLGCEATDRNSMTCARNNPGCRNTNSVSCRAIEIHRRWLVPM